MTACVRARLHRLMPIVYKTGVYISPLMRIVHQTGVYIAPLMPIVHQTGTWYKIETSDLSGNCVDLMLYICLVFCMNVIIKTLQISRILQYF